MPSITDAPLKPPLKWAGGKRWLAPHLRPLWEPFSKNRLVEPFCGGLAISMSFLPTKALLNDSNPHLIHFYLRLKRGLRIRIQMQSNEKLYYSLRELFNRLSRSRRNKGARAAEIFYYLNRTAFNGLCRFNPRGEFNVPFGQYKRINYTSDFTPYQQVFADWDFTSADFESVPLEPGDFVYADPPYDVQFTQYSKEAFTWDDQVRAAEWLARHKGPVILSNQATERIVALYEKLGFKLRFLDAPRRISCNGDRRPAKEVLALRNCG